MPTFLEQQVDCYLRFMLLPTVDEMINSLLSESSLPISVPLFLKVIGTRTEGFPKDLEVRIALKITGLYHPVDEKSTWCFKGLNLGTRQNFEGGFNVADGSGYLRSEFYDYPHD